MIPNSIPRVKAKTNNMSLVAIKYQINKLTLWIAVIISLHILAMRYFENLNYFEAIWLTLSTITTVGYGDLSAATLLGRLSTIILLYVGGIYVVAQTFGLYLDYKNLKHRKIYSGLWEWKLKNHIVMLNIPQINTVWFLSKFAQQLHSSSCDLKNKKILIITQDFTNGLPKTLADLGYYYKNALPNSYKTLVDAHISDASHIIAIAKNTQDLLSDAEVFDLVHRCRELNQKAMITAEIFDDPNRLRVLRAGANIVLRPLTAYPEMLARALIAPGSESILEKVFTSGGDECVRYNINLEKLIWIDLVKTCMMHGIGMPLAFADNKSTFLNPEHDTWVTCSALYVLVKEEHMLSEAEVRKIFSTNLVEQ